MNEPIARRKVPAPSRPGAWLDHHAYSIVASLGRLFRKPGSTALTIGVMAVALALPLGLWLVLANVERFAGDVQSSRQLSIFLKQDTAPARVAELVAALDGRADIGVVEHRTPAQGLEELRARSGLDEAIDALGENPLPHVLVVTPAGDEALLADSLRTLPEAELVQHDAGWRERLDNWLRFGGRVAWVLAALLGLGALLVVGNTVRLDIQSRREELGVLQLLGASDGFIRRPFLYLGAWYGLAAGALALGLLTVAGTALGAPLAELAASYGSSFALNGFAPRQALAVIAGATVLGWLGAGAVTGHFLRQTRPTET
ncbi:permease-like cell division protein FtsX [Luteimonas terricola]|uniref:Cell division protein FtsX n=1 Tax=Luteimonas terricola TaxID=645597 RepID=A0ABQ2E5S6_9GAMM|nr:permease-like cell division protein FtsX [Luteimonas terricola]GGJ97170.1 cell division protein FtsX [Luteimonas terricola]